MSTLFRMISLRRLVEERFQTLVAVLGVALGISVFLSIRLANGSVLGAFRSTVNAVSGKAQLQAVGGPTGLPDAAFVAAREAPGVAAVAPVVQATAVFREGQRGPEGEAPRDTDDVGRLVGAPVTVLGVDLFSEPPFRSFTLQNEAGGQETALSLLTDPRAIAITDKMAADLGLKVGDRMALQYGAKATEWRIVSILESDALGQAYGGRLAVADIAAAQEAFDKVGRLDRLDILVTEGASVEAVQDRLRAVLGEGVSVARPRARSEQVENLLAAFQLNLTALSAIAIFVGMFLIYNAMSIAVVRRRREIGILRELGVTQRQVLLMFLAEGTFYGVAGSVLGTVAGIALARAALQSVAETVTALYVRVEAERLILDPVILAQAVGLGFLTAVLASLAPAREAAATPPGQTAREGSLAAKSGPAAGSMAVAGVALLALAGALSWAASRFHAPTLGFAAAFGILGGFSLLTPLFTSLFARAIRPLWNRLFGAEGLLAAGYLAAALDRTAVVVAALMVSLAMFVGVSVMVGSFRQTVQAWVGQTIVADLYIQPSTYNVSGEDAVIPPETLKELEGAPNLSAMDRYRAAPGSYQGQRIVISAATFETLRKHGNLLFRNGTAADVFRRAMEDDEILVTEGFSLRFDKAEGDTVALPTPNGPREFRIAGVYYDYTTSGPTVLMDRALYRRVWNDDAINSVALYLAPGANPEAVRDIIERRQGTGGGLTIVVNRDLREHVLRIFDQTFRVTYALEFISIAVAVLGILNTMTALILQRARDLGILRAVGATPEQVRKIILLESGLIGIIGYLIGAACGATLAMLLIYVINKQFFGWTVQARWTPEVFAQGAALMIMTALVAGILPARQAARRSVTEAVRTE